MSASAITHEQWSSSARFVVVCAAAVIGLSGFWRLPFLVETYGGGAFLLVYLLAVVLLGLPLLSGQLLLARGTGADLPGVMASWMRETPHSRIWVWFGALAIVGATVLLACYTVVAGWSMAYSLRGVTGLLAGQDMTQARTSFFELARDAEKTFGWQLLFIGLVVATTAQGLRNGVAPVMRTLGLLIAVVFIVLLVAVSWQQADAMGMAQALFVADFAALGWRGVLEALYQAFFTLSLGTGVIVALGSYLPARAPVVRLAVGVVLLDLLAAWAAAFLFGVWLQDAGALLGGGLAELFVVLPATLQARWQVTLIYLLISLVALAAAIGLLEPLTRVLERRLLWSRLRASLHAGVLVWLVGLFGLLSFGVLDDVRWFDVSLFGWLLRGVTNLVLPVMGLVYCVFLGRILAKSRLRQNWYGAATARAFGFSLWYGMLRYPTRVVLAVVLFYALGGVAVCRWLWG